MKKLFIFGLILSSLTTTCQVPDTLNDYVSDGEYFSMLFHRANKTAYQIIGNAQTLTGLPTQMTGVAAGAHDYLAIDTGGWVYTAGINQNGECGLGSTANISNMTKILVDSAGNPFHNIIQAVYGNLTDSSGAGGWTVMFLKADGTVWICGFCSGGGRGLNGYFGLPNTTRPVQIPMPGGAFIVQINMGAICMARDNTGKMYTWGGANNIFNSNFMMGQGVSNPKHYTPTLVPLPLPAIDIAGGVTGTFALLNNHRVYGCSSYLGLIGVGSTDGGNNAFQTPGATNYSMFDITDSLHLSAAVNHIVCNSLVNYFLLADSTIWANGDNVVGGLGNGIEPNYALTPSPYFWNLGFGNPYNIVQNRPSQVAPGIHDFVAVFSGTALNYYAHAARANGQLIAIGGRNKGGVIGNGAMDCDATTGVEGQYPTSWDVVWPETINPIGGITYLWDCPYCVVNPTGFPCSNCAVPTSHNVTAALTATVLGNNKVKLDASASTATASSGSPHFRVAHTTVTCAGCLMSLQGNVIDTIQVPGPGTYTTRVTVTDGYTATANTTVTFTVTGPVNNVQWFRKKRGYKRRFF